MDNRTELQTPTGEARFFEPHQTRRALGLARHWTSTHPTLADHVGWLGLSLRADQTAAIQIDTDRPLTDDELAELRALGTILDAVESRVDWMLGIRETRASAHVLDESAILEVLHGGGGLRDALGYAVRWLHQAEAHAA